MIKSNVDVTLTKPNSYYVRVFQALVEAKFPQHWYEDSMCNGFFNSNDCGICPMNVYNSWTQHLFND